MISSPGLIPSAIKRDEQRLGAAGDSDAVLRARVVGELAFEFGHFGAHDVLAMVEHLVDAGVDGALERLILGLEVDELDFHVFPQCCDFVTTASARDREVVHLPPKTLISRACRSMTDSRLAAEKSVLLATIGRMPAKA